MNPRLLTKRQLALICGYPDAERFNHFLSEVKLSSTAIPQLYGTSEFINLAVQSGLLRPGSVLPWPPP